MPSRADLRRAGEWTLRGAALGLLAWALYASTFGSRPPAATTVDATYDTAAIVPRLEDWSRRGDLAHVHMRIDVAPGAVVRDWLHALGRTATRVSWAGGVPATAIAVDPLADPRGGARVSVAAPAGETAVVADAVGRIDSIVAAHGGGTLRVPVAVGPFTARVAGTDASTTAPGRRHLRTVVVLATAGWEARFVASALEERGWPVAVRLRVAPGLSVGSTPALDTATVSAVIALDSAAAGSAASIAAYVRTGGGLLLGTDAARTPALAGLVVGRPGTPVRAATSFAAAVAPVTRLTLAHTPLVGLRPDAVVLEQRRDTVLVAARRLDAGRVVQVGYDETWRWRMAGGDESPAAHRAWWAALVEAVAYAPIASDPPGGAPAEGAGREGAPYRAELARGSAPAAPRAALVAALGEAAGAPADAMAEDGIDPSRSLTLYIAVALLLLAEWASRRLRGAK